MTDACTLWFDRIGSLDWSTCCRAHDLAYDTGAGKLSADVDLMLCVAHAGGWPMGIVMFAGVTVFGPLFYYFARRPAGRKGTTTDAN